MILKFITKSGFESDLEVKELVSIDGRRLDELLKNQDEDIEERVARLEGSVGLLLELIKGEQE